MPPLLGSEEAGQGSIELAAGLDSPGGGGGAGGDVDSVATTDPALSVAPTTGNVLVAQRVQATWAIANVRWYAIDDTNGNDGNAGFSDTSSADAGTKAKKTLAGLGAIFPRIGAGRKVVVMFNQGDYSGQGGLETLLASCSGYCVGFPLILATGTNATAGAVAFAGNAADRIYAGAVTVAGLNAAGYNPIGTPTVSVVQCAKVGGGVPGFPAEPADPLGWRIRFDSATTTAALRNVCAMIVQVTTDTLTLPNNTTNGGALPVAPALTDTFYVEKAGVIVDATTLNIAGASTQSFSSTTLQGFMTLVGLDFNGSTNTFSFGGLHLAFCGFQRAASVYFRSCDPEWPIVGYKDETGTQRNVGSTVKTSSIRLFCSPVAANFDSNINPSVHTGAVSIDQALMVFLCNSAVLAGGAIIQNLNGDLVFNPGTTGTEPNTLIGGRLVNSQGNVRVLAPAPAAANAGLFIQASRLSLGKLAITGMGANPGIILAGRCGICVTSSITGSTGNTDVGLDLTRSWGSVIFVSSTPTLTGSAGDIRLGGGQITTWAAVAATGLVDSNGNRFISASAPLVPVAKFSGVLINSEGAGSSFLSDYGIGEALTPGSGQVDPSRYPTSMRLITRMRACVPLGTNAFQSVVFTLYKNGVATAQTCSIGVSQAAGTKAIDLAHPILFGDGDDFDVFASGTINANLPVSVMLEGPC